MVGGPGRSGWHGAANGPSTIAGVAARPGRSARRGGLIREVVADAPASSPLVGIGISVPGMVRRSDGLVRLAPNLEWHDVSFGSDRPRRPGRSTCPISLANDADLGALAEHQRGVGVGDRRPHLRLGQRRRRCRRHHRRAPAGGCGRLRRRDRPPALQPGRQALPLRQPRLLGDRGRCARDRRGDPVPRGQGAPAWRGPRRLREGDPGAARHRRPPSGQGLASMVNVFNPQIVVLGGYFDAHVHPGAAPRSTRGWPTGPCRPRSSRCP